MASPRIIAIVGGTGIQGSSVARTFASLQGWQVRCLTRNPTSSKAKALLDIGCELVRADLADQDSLARAFVGAHALFINANFFEHYIPSLLAGAGFDKSAKIGFDTEVLHAKNAFHAAQGIETLERIVYSAFGPMKRASGGKYSHSMHWEAKAAAVDYLQADLPELAKKVSLIYPATYATNYFLYPHLEPSTGVYKAVIPTTKDAAMPVLDPARSLGPFVRALVEDEELGTKLMAYDSWPSLEKAFDLWSQATGKPYECIETTPEAMQKLTKVPPEILDAVPYIKEFGYYAGVDGAIRPDQLRNRPQTKSYDQFLKDSEMSALLGEGMLDVVGLFQTVKE